MKKIGRKEIRNMIEGALHQALFSLQVVPSGKVKKMIRSMSKKFTAEVKRELKKQLKKETEKAGKKAKTISSKP